MSYFHFTTFERGQLESLYKLGYSTRKIGSILKRHHSSIARELKRNSKENKVYDSEQAHRQSMEFAIKQLTSMYPSTAFQTATVDRGKEFSCYQRVENDLKIAVFFADPYSSWQRGSNENANGLLREFYPKKTDLSLVSQQQLNQALLLINQRPRKCLGWKTAHEAFQEELSHLD
ncbi:IS30 family transposase [Bacillus fungorum]|uniref:IS30 family transposase n=2 Tax=Bacillus fungorum TaxID=2039284 RepID=UPI0033980663